MKESVRGSLMALYLLLWCFFVFCANIGEPGVIGNSDIQNRICHSCARGGISMSCYCDNMCTFYKDCCFDAPGETTKDTIQTDVRPSCWPLSFRKSIYVVQECLSSWGGPSNVRSKCEKPNDLSDMFISIPVTDTKTKLTYRNRYCAECNNVVPSSLSSFSLKLSCDNLLEEVNNSYGNITEDFIYQNIIFHHNSWGVYHWNRRDGGMSFVRCHLLPEIPTKLSPLLRDCQINVKSTCSFNWNDDLTQQLCISSNINIVYNTEGRAYRNAHCALCNYIPVNEIHCGAPVIYRSTPRPEISTFSPSFIVLLDINWLNRNSMCSSNEIYDSFAKKCRRLICTHPDEVPSYGKCAKRGK